MKKHILLTGSFLGFLSVALGAFGAHLLEDYLFWSNRLETFDIAVRYQFYHVFFIFIIASFYETFDKTHLHYAFYLCLIGIILFSGSLYTLCITNMSFFGFITPIGGVCLMLAWICFAISVIKKK